MSSDHRDLAKWPLVAKRVAILKKGHRHVEGDTAVEVRDPTAAAEFRTAIAALLGQRHFVAPVEHRLRLVDRSFDNLPVDRALDQAWLALPTEPQFACDFSTQPDRRGRRANRSNPPHDEQREERASGK